MAKPVVLRSYLNTNDAHFVKLLLEDAGIPVHIYDDNTSNIAIGYNNVTGGIKIVVPDDHVEEALEIIEKDFENQKEFQNQKIYCPECDSENISKIKPPTIIGALGVFLLGIYSTFIDGRSKYVCNNCDHSWKDF